MNGISNSDNYQSKYTKEQMQEMYPTIDTYRLGWALVASMNDKFDTLIWDYFFEVLNIDLHKLPIDKDNLVGFGILVFESGNRKQFVSEITKEVLFEVWVESAPRTRDIFLYGDKPCDPVLKWCEFWRKDK